MAAIQATLVYGSRMPGEKLKPIKGAPDGKWRLRFRSDGAARLFVRNTSGTFRFYLEDYGDHWGAFPDGSNLTPSSPCAW